MTLSSRLWVTGPLPGGSIDALWEGGRELIHRLSDPTLPPATFTDVESKDWHEYRPGTRERSHDIGQGFCAIYKVTYHPDGQPVQTGEITHGEFCDDPCEDPHTMETIPFTAMVYLDTSYGYRLDLPDGGFWNAGDLHRAIIGVMGAWLDANGVPWCWYDEFTCTVHQGAEGLVALSSGMDQASAWFHRVVQPAIDAEAAATGGTVEWS